MIFVDEARIFIKSGDGGQGCESFYKDKYMRYRRPDGGDGGRGGDVIFKADRSVQTLLDFRYKQHYKAQKGGNASSNGKKGKVGTSCVLRVPAGTIIKDNATGLIIKDLVEDQQLVVVAKGASGGLGNQKHKNPRPPHMGEEITISLELKLIADIGLVGFPNAGKSTIISRISRVKSKIASYPFTTKSPILGIVMDEEEDHFVVADLPGIIEGAHEGRGLGDRFLRHTERTKILVHVIDMGAVEGRNPIEDYKKLLDELHSYSDNLAQKSKILVANKMDVEGAQENLKRFKKEISKEIIPVSAVEGDGIDVLVAAMRAKLCQENSQEKLSESSLK